MTPMGMSMFLANDFRRAGHLSHQCESQGRCQKIDDMNKLSFFFMQLEVLKVPGSLMKWLLSFQDLKKYDSLSVGMRVHLTKLLWI